jgi:membrane protein DedA with SNARE-associated domain
MNLLEQFVGFFGEYGYVAVLLALLICSLGVPLPEDITLVAGGVIAGLGYANVHLMALLAFSGVLVGDLIMFSLGSHFGTRILGWWPIARLVTPTRYALVQEKFEQYGNRVLFTARFLPGMRAAVFVTAGLSHRVSVWRFLLLDGLAALISVPVWVYLGYFGANNDEWLLKWLHRGQAGLWLLLATILVVIGVYWWRRHKRAKSRSASD